MSVEGEGGRGASKDIQPHDLGRNGFGPRHEEGVLAFDAVDGCLWDIVDTEIGLMEHVAAEYVREATSQEGICGLRIPVKAKQIAHGRVTRIVQKVSEGSLTT